MLQFYWKLRNKKRLKETAASMLKNHILIAAGVTATTLQNIEYLLFVLLP